MTARAIDINCDMGERPGDEGIAADVRLMDFVSSANVACAGHAGDEATARALVAAAAARGLGIGAHPGYADRANFGRATVAMHPREAESMLAEQLRFLKGIASNCGAAVNHVKPHGALYHDVMLSDETAAAFTRAILQVWADGPRPILVGLAGTKRLAQWRSEGFTVAAEGFAERRYLAGGGLVPRTEEGAVITDPHDAACQAVDIALHRCAPARADAGSPRLVTVAADTICIHSDSPGAEAIAAAVRAALMREGCVVRGLASRPS